MASHGIGHVLMFCMFFVYVTLLKFQVEVDFCLVHFFQRFSCVENYAAPIPLQINMMHLLKLGLIV